jgi:SAM-dependent methyltransferase
VGCGTGTLAIAAKRQVGTMGTVYGVDASPEMIARAGKKASKAGVEIVLKNGLAEALPFPDGHFDAVLSTVMLHHLPGKLRSQCAGEMLEGTSSPERSDREVDGWPHALAIELRKELSLRIPSQSRERR